MAEDVLAYHETQHGVIEGYRLTFAVLGDIGAYEDRLVLYADVSYFNIAQAHQAG